MVVGCDHDGELIDQMSMALQGAENTLRRIVESEDYVWNGEDVEYMVFTKGDRRLPDWIPGPALDRHSHGTACATGVVTARRPG